MIRRILLWLGLVRGRFQVYDGPLDGHWTDSTDLPGYRLVEDMYSERQYHLWQPAEVSYETIAEALDNSRDNTDEQGVAWFAGMSDEDLRDDLMDKCADAEDADPDRILLYVRRYRMERGL